MLDFNVRNYINSHVMIAWLLIFIVTSNTKTAIAAPSLSVLHSFSALSSGDNSDGANPGSCSLVQYTDGTFYGTTFNGGISGLGTVYQVTPTGTVTTIHNFTGSDGEHPRGGLVIGSDGNLYGTTESGGDNDDGTFYQILPAVVGSGFVPTFNSLYSFDGAKGSSPSGQLVEGTDGNFYGTTQSGGASGFGTVYKISPSGAITSLVSFSGVNGKTPIGGLTIGADNNFYGATSLGGSSSKGNIFKITSSGNLTSIASFNGTNGATPNAILTLEPNGNFYGTTSSGGSNNEGTVYQITPNGTLTTLTSFTGVNGATPLGGVIIGVDGNIYGVTSLGGASGVGAFYKLTPAGSLTPQYSFTSANGSNPSSGITVGFDGNFYGTANAGAQNSTGSIYKITIESTKIFQFSATNSTGINADGQNPGGSALVQGPDSTFYGSTEAGGASGVGTIYKITPAGVESTLYSFDPSSLNTPVFGITIGADGNFYGTTNNSQSGFGGIFKITPTGVFSELLDFGSTNGNSPDNLTLGSDGNFYGTTFNGGTNGQGQVYRITPTGTFTDLHDFTGADGANPITSVSVGPDGNFYGTTSEGGSSGGGTIYKITPSGDFTLLDSLTNSAGTLPYGSLTVGADGNLYGTTESGGLNGLGTFFRVTLTGNLTTLYSFGNNDGQNIRQNLSLGNDGKLYGTAQVGGAANYGTVFKFTPTGKLTTLISFDGYDGAGPGSSTLGFDGNYYVTTTYDNVTGSGTIVEVNGPPTVSSNTSPISVSENVTKTGTITFSNPSGVTTDFTDFVITTPPLHGTVVVSSISDSGATGTVKYTYTPASNFTGTDSFSYTLNSLTGVSGIGTATFAIKLTPPVITTGPSINLKDAKSATLAVTTIGGATPLSYAWAFTGPGTVSFSPANNSTSANPVVATFTKAGTYTFKLIITDAAGEKITATLAPYSVTTTLSQVTVSPTGTVTAPIRLNQNAVATLTATAFDQFGVILATQPSTSAWTWKVATGGAGGSLGTFANNTAVYTAPSSTTGLDTVTATASGVTGTTVLNISHASLGGNLSGSVASPGPTSVNLTAEGTKDWIDFGRGVPGVDRKASGGSQIGYSYVGSLLGLRNDLRSYTWSDGSPLASSPAITDAVYLVGVNDQFAITAQADTTTRTLVVYVGGTSSTGKLVAHLSDGSATDYTDTMTTAPTGLYDRQYTLTYSAASAGKQITVTWTATSAPAGASSNITLGATTLH